MTTDAHPAHPVLEISLRVLAVILAVLGIILTWLTDMAVITAAVLVLAGVSQLAQVGRGGIVAIDGRLDRLSDRVLNVEDSANQLAQNVADKGLIMTLLPADREQELQAAAQTAVQGFDNIQTAAETAANLRRVVDGALGVVTGKPPAQADGPVVTILSELQADAQALGADIRDFRDGRAANVARVAAAARRLDARIANARSGLARLDQDLAALQTGLGRAGRLIRFIFGLTATLATLAFLYVIWCQIVLIRRVWARRQAAVGSS